jgi:hypothetical protein
MNIQTCCFRHFLGKEAVVVVSFGGLERIAVVALEDLTFGNPHSARNIERVNKELSQLFGGRQIEVKLKTREAWYD